MEIDELAATITDRMIVPASLSIVTAGTVPKLYFDDKSRLFQKTKRVVDGRIADPGQTQTRSLKYLIRGGMIFPVLNHHQDRLTLGRQVHLGFHVLGNCRPSHGLRLILILSTVKRGQPNHQALH